MALGWFVLSTVAIVGGGGLVSQCASYDLSLSKEVERIIVADIDIGKAREVAQRTNRLSGTRKATAIRVDVRNTGESADAVREADVLVNGVQYDFNEKVMQLSLRVGAHYIDFGGLYWMTKKQLRHSSEFRKAGLLAVVGMGAEPGLSGLMARELCDRMDSVETIKIRDGWRDYTKGVPPFFVTWSIQTLMDEYTMPGEVYEEGRVRKYRPLELSEEYDFPEPVGKTVVYSTRHSEMATFPSSFRAKGVRNVNWMEGGPGFIEQKLLADAGFGDSKALAIGELKVSPRRFLLELLKSKGLLGYPRKCRPDSFECLAVEVSGQRGGERVVERRTCTFPSKPEWGLGAAEYSVGIPGAAATRVILSGKAERRGVLPPEIAFSPEDFYPELVERGFRLTPVERV